MWAHLRTCFYLVYLTNDYGAPLQNKKGNCVVVNSLFVFLNSSKTAVISLCGSPREIQPANPTLGLIDLLPPSSLLLIFLHHLSPRTPFLSLMAKLHGDRVAKEDFEGHEEEEFGTGGHCLSCFCLLCPLGKPERVGYRSLPHGDCTKGKCWEGGGQRAKELLLLESMARMRWRSLANKVIRSRNNIKRRKPGLSYDSRSYKLNFDDGPDGWIYDRYSLHSVDWFLQPLDLLFVISLVFLSLAISHALTIKISWDVAEELALQ